MLYEVITGSLGVSFLVTDDPQHFRSVGESFYGAGMDAVEKVAL